MPGPTLVSVGGIHANEPAGIDAAISVHSSLDGSTSRLGRGRFLSLRGNLAALAADAPEPLLRDRYIQHDLNRVFHEPRATGAARSIEHRERDELWAALESAANEASGPTYLLDLHTVSSDSPPFLVLEDSLPARRFASWFPLPKVLGMEEELRGLLVDEATNRLGCVSCIVEAGRHDDPRAVDVHESILLLALEGLGMLERPARTARGEDPATVAAESAGVRRNEYYDLRERVEIRDPSFRMQPHAAAFSRVRAGRTVLAVEGSRSITAGADGLLFLPNRQPVTRPGDDAFFVVARVRPVWLAVSARIRNSAALHRCLPLLPGVRTRPNDPHALLIAPEYAAVFRRELLHLLGYRLVRFSPIPYHRPATRAVLAFAGLLRSMLGILARAFRGGERAALPEERPTDWIARRRYLDLHRPGTRGDRT